MISLMARHLGAWALPVSVLAGGVLLAASGGLLERAASPLSDDARCAPQGHIPTAAEPELVAALSDAVWAEPQDMDCTLSRAGLNRRGFVTLLDTVASDPLAAPRYEAARRLVPSALR